MRFLILIFLQLLPYPLVQGNLDPLTWSHSLLLDVPGQFHLAWIPREHDILFQMSAQTRGSLAIGFSPNGGMAGADIIMAWVDANGNIVFHDRHAKTTLSPEIDQSQDCSLIGGYENDTHTVIQFSRPWDTCDPDQDLVLGSDTVRLIWAFHPEDPTSLEVLPYHGHQRRGVRSVYLREAPHLSVQEQMKRTGEHVKVWDVINENLTLPNDDHTHYWCNIFEAPQLEEKHHMIGFVPLIESGHESYVHHMVLYECHVPDDSTDHYFAHHVNGAGARCYSPNMPPEWSYCLATNTWAWAVGSEGETLPPNVGIPLGENFNGATYFMLETHFDNPAFHQDLVDSSGLRIFYTSELREHDAGMILLGSEVNFLHLIPPLQESFTTVGRCTSACTQKGLDGDGITILHGVLHSHLAGRKMRLRFIRNGQELPMIAEDNNYDFNYQVSREPPIETKVLPGDELLLECDYNTRFRDEPTFGGLSTREEMCLGFFWYYPRQKLADCRSLPTLQSLMKAFGIDSIFGKSFEKLAVFLKDIDGSQDSNGASLEDLLNILASETGSDLSHALTTDPNGFARPITEEDLLNKPFYTVASDPPQNQGISQSIKDYRNFMSDMLLKIRIKTPLKYFNRTIAEHFALMNWMDPNESRDIQDAIRFGDHSSLCLAHGRKPLIPYEAQPYPQFFSSETIKTKCHIRNHTRVLSKYTQARNPMTLVDQTSSSIITKPFHVSLGIALFFVPFTLS